MKFLTHFLIRNKPDLTYTLIHTHTQNNAQIHQGFDDFIAQETDCMFSRNDPLNCPEPTYVCSYTMESKEMKMHTFNKPKLCVKG